MSEERKLIATNKKARFNYSVEESIECGVVLEGTEVKSVKAGSISFPDAFAEIINNEVWIRGLHISEYSYSSLAKAASKMVAVFIIQTDLKNCCFIKMK